MRSSLRHILSSAVVALLASTTSAELVITNVERFSASEENLFRVSATNETESSIVVDFYRPADLSPEFLAIMSYSNAPDVFLPATLTNLLEMPELIVDTPMVVVSYESADKTTYLGDTNANPYGIGTYQAGGPEHAYLVGQYEIDNSVFCMFLNDAQANTSNARGANMFFEDFGYVVFNPDKVGVAKPSSNDVFDIFAVPDIPITYTATNPIGMRYAVKDGFEDYPVGGVSWYGAVKFCNWLTIMQGFGESVRAYTEGPNPPDWRPAPATNWPVFTDEERQFWVENYAGFRLPMLGTNGWGPSLYNEYYKVATWNGSSNVIYGFGRNELEDNDANFDASGDPFDDSATPVGYYDGSEQGGYQTASNQNHYNAFDLSGNVGEWLNDSILHPVIRAYSGGTYLTPEGQMDPGITNYALARLTVEHVGFRVALSTSVTGAPPLVISPAGGTTSTVPGGVLFSALGGSGAYTWSISDTAIGEIFDFGAVGAYNPTNCITCTQLVTLADGLVALTTVVVHTELVIPPPPPPLP